jgi:tetratricopeptide (TPR) repeat protein
MSEHKTPPLHELIHSLTTNEKRYFKLSTATSAGDKNYQKLFNAIEKQKIDNPKELKKRMSNMNVSYEKAYLQKMLMRSLRNFHEDSSTEITLHQTLTDIEILFNKQNYDLCTELIKEGIKLAEENEHDSLLLQLLKWQRRIMIRQGQYNDVVKQNAELIAKETGCIRRLENMIQLKDLQAHFLYHISRKGNARVTEEMEEFEKLIKHPLLQDEKNALSHNARLLFFDCWNWYYQHTLKIDEAYKNMLRMVSYIEENPKKILLHPQSYMVSLSSLANRCSNYGKYDEALQAIEKMEQMHTIKGIKIPKGLQTEILTYSIERRLMIYAFNRQFEKGIEWYNKTKVEVEKNKKVLKPNFIGMYHQLVALCYVHTHNYEEAVSHLQVVLNDISNRQRQDTFLYSHMLNIIAHFELKNYQLLPYLIKSAKRFADSRGFKQEVVALFFKMFTELTRKNSKQDKTRIFTEYGPKVIALNEINQESVLIGTLDLYKWMSERLQ